MSVTGEMLSGADAAAFGRHFMSMVRATSGGDWLPYRDLLDRSVGELPDNAFVQWLAGHPRRRSKLKYVLDLSAVSFPDVERRKDGEAQSARVFYRTRPVVFDIVTDRRTVGRWFGVWRRALMHGGRGERGVWETPEGLLAITLPLPSPRTLGRRVALGYDPTGATWTLQINQPTAPETHNVHSALATSPDGRPVLLRQGTLQRNRRNKVLITGAAFRTATALFQWRCRTMARRRRAPGISWRGWTTRPSAFAAPPPPSPRFARPRASSGPMPMARSTRGAWMTCSAPTRTEVATPSRGRPRRTARCPTFGARRGAC